MSPVRRTEPEAPPREIARDLGWAMGKGDTAFSYAALADEAASRYWDNRVARSNDCGTVHGYYWHRNHGTLQCGDCKKARARVVAVQRRRVAA